MQPKFSMAPMAGVTDFSFRMRLRRRGCRYLYTEMVSAAALARRNRKTLGYLRPPDLGPDLALQLFGAQPEELAEAALTAQEAGFRALDFNMGCPVRKVVKSGAGSALLLDPERSERCLRALRRAVAGRFTVKLRSGWDAAHLNGMELAKMAADCGADGVTLHARTRAQGYSGRADWSLVGALARNLPIPVVGNGDVSSGAEAVERLSQTGCAGVMIGRAALSEPWIFAEAESLSEGAGALAPPSPAQIGEDLLLHLEDLVRDKGERVAVLDLRKFVAWAAKGLPGAAPFRRRVQTTACVRELAQEIRTFFGDRH
ncbi:MAG: tRNA-dihydrouridine synthase [Deltaproteobacteria bacterium]|nr:tRNA-dihydrouridine synthase [Deltaproteobacteria bacterium]